MCFYTLFSWVASNWEEGGGHGPPSSPSSWIISLFSIINLHYSLTSLVFNEDFYIGTRHNIAWELSDHQIKTVLTAVMIFNSILYAFITLLSLQLKHNKLCNIAKPCSHNLYFDKTIVNLALIGRGCVMLPLSLMLTQNTVLLFVETVTHL